MLAPAALLAIAAEPDSNIPLDAVRSAAARAGEPNRLVPLPMGHFDNDEEPWRAQPVEEAVAWFRTHLQRAARSRRGLLTITLEAGRAQTG